MVSSPTNTVLKKLLTSRKMWAIVFLALVSLIGSRVPGFQMDADQAVAMTVIVVGYIAGVAIDPGKNAGNWRGVIKSRKFWAAFVGLVIVFLDAFKVVVPLGLTSEQLITLAAGLGTYIAGVGVEGLMQQLPAKPPV